MILPSLAIALLVVATAYSSIVSFRKRPEEASQSWIFPEGTKRWMKLAVAFSTVALLIGLAVWASDSGGKTASVGSRFLIPQGYVGWLRIEFEVPGAPPVPVERGKQLFKFTHPGVLKTSSMDRADWNNSEYFYDSPQGPRPLGQSRPGGGGLIWGKINGESTGPAGTKKYREFFIGTEDQFREQTQ